MRNLKFISYKIHLIQILKYLFVTVDKYIDHFDLNTLPICRFPYLKEVLFYTYIILNIKNM